MKSFPLERILAAAFLLLLVNAAYVFALPAASIFYVGNVLAHLGLGILVIALGLVWLVLDGRKFRVLGLAFFPFLLSAGFAAFLVVRYNVRENRWALAGHIVTSLLAMLMLAPGIFRAAKEFGGGWPAFRRAFAAAGIFALLLPAGAYSYRKLFPNPSDRIRNPLVVPTSMQEEGGGPKSPFFPSSARTNVGGTIPSNFFMDSQLCGECHKDIYEQWKSSVHHFASFNNQFYRKSIEHMQEVLGTQPTKWCAGCHDHAVFFNGRFDKPIKDQIDTPEAQNGLGCVSCHSIVHVDSSMGNGGFTIEYPKLHDLASSRNPLIRKIDRFVTYLNPEPHRKTFLKPFMRADSAEFCSTCHKVHLDVPVNNYRWMRGFNDYDNWQASGVSGQGARSFYYPAKTSACSDCHMPLVPSRDPGHREGQVHSHRFPAANMAVPFVNGDKEQMKVTEDFLKSGFITVDIFSASPVDAKAADTPMVRRAGEGPALSSTMAVGEEAEQAGQVFIREVGKIAAPLDRAPLALEPGSTARVDVVVRTRKVGHFFPGGTVDSFDIWLELQGFDSSGKTVFWSGRADDDGKGPVETGAHFYRSYQLDSEGNPINKRNAFQSRSVLYVRLIPPGAADVAHYRVKIPKDAKGPITLKAKLNYRKFSHYYTQYAFAGQPKPGQDPSLVSKDHDSRTYSFEKANIPANVSGNLKGEIPDLPIVTLATAETKLQIADGKGAGPEWNPVVEKKDRERWNDWGIGLLLQGDLKGAEYAFRKVTEAEPEYADGWLNVARALIQEGEIEAAKPFVQKALAINPKLGRVHFFKAMAEKAEGDYDAALASLRTAESMYPRDRVVLNQIARILFLKREYKQAIEALRRVGQVDPEDVQMHYTAMLAYRGLGDMESAAREEKLFRRFKADESAQAITGKRRLVSAEENNERQQIHDHEGVPLAPKRAAGKSAVARAKSARAAVGASE